jgi:hypothetical protein
MRNRFGKDYPSPSEEHYIDRSLTGGSGPSNGMHKYPVDRRDQHILTAVAMDNVKLAMHEPSSILDTHFYGGCENIEHSLKGATAVNEEVGAAGPVKHVVIPWH